MIGPTIEPSTTGGIAIVDVIFMLLRREDLRDRVIRLAGAGELQRTTEALDDAMRRVAHNPHAARRQRTIRGSRVSGRSGFRILYSGQCWPWCCGSCPIGPIVAAAFPLLLSIAVDPGWSMLLWTAALFIVLEIVSNNFVEPWLYGSGTGLSPVAIIVAAIFWTWLWGPVGLLLSTPLTICFVVLGRHVPQLAFMNTLLGDEPVSS